MQNFEDEYNNKGHPNIYLIHLETQPVADPFVVKISQEDIYKLPGLFVGDIVRVSNLSLATFAILKTSRRYGIPHGFICVSKPIKKRLRLKPGTLLGLETMNSEQMTPILKMEVRPDPEGTKSANDYLSKLILPFFRGCRRPVSEGDYFDILTKNSLINFKSIFVKSENNSNFGYVNNFTIISYLGRELEVGTGNIRSVSPSKLKNSSNAMESKIKDNYGFYEGFKEYMWDSLPANKRNKQIIQNNNTREEEEEEKPYNKKNQYNTNDNEDIHGFYEQGFKEYMWDSLPANKKPSKYDNSSYLKNKLKMDNPNPNSGEDEIGYNDNSNPETKRKFTKQADDIQKEVQAFRNTIDGNKTNKKKNQESPKVSEPSDPFELFYKSDLSMKPPEERYSHREFINKNHNIPEATKNLYGSRNNNQIGNNYDRKDKSLNESKLLCNSKGSSDSLKDLSKPNNKKYNKYTNLSKFESKSRENSEKDPKDFKSDFKRPDYSNKIISNNFSIKKNKTYDKIHKREKKEENLLKFALNKNNKSKEDSKSFLNNSSIVQKSVGDVKYWDIEDDSFNQLSNTNEIIFGDEPVLDESKVNMVRRTVGGIGRERSSIGEDRTEQAYLSNSSVISFLI